MNVMRLDILVVLSALLAAGCASHDVRQNNGQAVFYLRCSQAREVALATSLDGFVPHKTRRTGFDLWVVEVKASQDFSYFYLVDGKVLMPDCRSIQQDDFGGVTCVYSNVP